MTLALKNAKILFIGNSYTFQNDLPGLIRDIADPCGMMIETESVVTGGMTLEWHWDQGEAQAAIRKGGWNFVVMQEQSLRPVEDPAAMHAAIRRFAPLVREIDAKPALYLTWARRNAPERQGDYNQAYRAIGAEIGAVVVPVGEAWRRIWKGHPEIALYEEDLSHPTLAGSYLAACVFSAALFEIDPRGAPDLGLDASVARILQEAAWDAALAERGSSPVF